MSWVYLGDKLGINKILAMKTKQAFPLLKIKFKPQLNFFGHKIKTEGNDYGWMVMKLKNIDYEASGKTSQRKEHNIRKYIISG